MKRLLFLGLLVAGCSSKPVDGALLAVVDFGAGTTCQCLQVVVRTPEGTEVRSGPVKTSRTRPAKIGIAKEGLPDEVTVYAVGFSDSACLTPSVPPERSEDGVGTFKVSRTSTVLLTIQHRANQKDDDGDGYASVVSGGDDCDDTDASVHPGAVEACGDGADNDCNRAKDCEESKCAGKTCGLTVGATCQPPKCAEQLCNDDADNDGDGLRDCADPDCAGQTCKNGGKCTAGACKGASTEKDLCADGADNDADGKVDCADSDCAGGLCSSGNACQAGEKCDNAGQCTGGQPVTCNMPSGVCLQGVGTCNPADGGCLYAPDPGKACNDGNGCTTGDQCSDAGTCAGTMGLCPATVPCTRSAGCQPDAGCVFVPAVGDVCDDGNSCTAGETCQLDAGCAGGTASAACVASACQTFANVCTGDGGCVFDARDAGEACDAGGVCNGGGVCIPKFPYPPSNFSESALPVPAPPTVLGCAVTIDTHLTDGGVGFGTWCGNPVPAYRLLPRGAGLADAVLLAFTELDVGLDASVRTQGDRPVIFASTGNLKVSGEVVAFAGALGCADGGSGGAAAGDKGGGGGGFGTAGGAGGKSGGAGGMVNGEASLVPLRGGCPGGNGVSGGGGVQLSAAGNLTITGTVAAPGSGGPGGSPANGPGKGGGSGGGVLLEGLLVLVGPSGAVTANGGAGGEGADLVFGGNPGNAGAIKTDAPAQGGQSLNGGGRGGDGAAGSSAPLDGNGSLINAGGGGGAGLGRVRINTATTCSLGGTAKLSPRPASLQADAGCS